MPSSFNFCKVLYAMCGQALSCNRITFFRWMLTADVLMSGIPRWFAGSTLQWWFCRVQVAVMNKTWWRPTNSHLFWMQFWLQECGVWFRFHFMGGVETLVSLAWIHPWHVNTCLLYHFLFWKGQQVSFKCYRNGTLSPTAFMLVVSRLNTISYASRIFWFKWIAPYRIFWCEHFTVSKRFFGRHVYCL